MEHTFDLESEIGKIETLMSIQKFTLAERELKTLFANAPNEPRVLKLRLRLFNALARYADTISLASQMLASSPDDTTVCFYLAYALDFDGKAAEAIDLWRDLVRREPNDADFHAGLASAMFWNPEMKFPADEVELHLARALKIAPVHRVAKQVEFWLAHRKKDSERMREIVAEVQNAFPGERIAAAMLARFIHEFKREDSAVIPSLLAVFPNDPELLSLAKEVHAESELSGLIENSIFEIFTTTVQPWMAENGISEEDLSRPYTLLKAATEGGPSFGVRKLASHLLEQLNGARTSENAALAFTLMRLCAGKTANRVRLQTFLEAILKKVEKQDLDTVVQRAFSLGLAEIYSYLFTHIEARPSQETWSLIWDQVQERGDLLEQVLERYGLFEPRPPVTLELLIEPKTGEIRKAMSTILKHLCAADTNLVTSLWRIYVDRADGLKETDRSMLLNQIAAGSLAPLLGSPEFATQLKAMVQSSANSYTHPLTRIWEGLAYLPDADRAPLTTNAFVELRRYLCLRLLDGSLRDQDVPVALFLSRTVTGMAEIADCSAALSDLAKKTANAQLRGPLNSLLERFTVETTVTNAKVISIEREKLAGERADLERQKLELQKSRIENEKLSRLNLLGQMKTDVASLSSAFQAKVLEIQNSSGTALEKAARLRAETEAFQNEIARRTKA